LSEAAAATPGSGMIFFFMVNAGFVDEPGLYTRRKKIYYKLLHGADVAIDNPDWTTTYSQMDEA
jgi:hypothetical protein